MTKKTYISIKIIASLCLLLIIFPSKFKAYTDLSTYRIETGKFGTSNQAKIDLERLQGDTGWTGTYQTTGDYREYNQIISGLYSGETRVKSVLQQFEAATGINANYVGAGEAKDYFQIVSGLYTGEAKVKSVLQQFENSTGIQGNYVGVGEPKYYYQIISGGFSGESWVKDILQEFESKTGINGNYEGVGASQYYYEISSGGFMGETRVKEVLQQFIKATGINATYISLGNNKYKIKSTPVLGLTAVNKGLSFFKNNSWYATYQSTGKKGYNTYRIKSDPVLGPNLLQKGLEYFKSNDWYATYQSTGKGYEKYQIKSVPLLGLDLVNKGLLFFKNHNFAATYLATGKKGYDKYQIKSDPVLGASLLNKGLEFFKSRNFAVIYQSTGQKQYYYEIVINNFNGYDKAVAAIQTIKQLYGWSAIAVKTKNGPQLMYTDYGLTLNSMLEKQMVKYPQTDLYRNAPRFVSANYVDMDNQVITGNGVNLRSSPSMDGTIVQQLNTGDEVLVIGKTGDWVEVRLTWQNAFVKDVKHYLDPNSFSINSKDYFQFLKLSQPANLSASEVNEKILKGKGTLAGKGQAFIDAAKKYNINDVYLISHALLETGNGTSKLATGVVVNGKTVYNMFGYGAVDSCPITCGAQTAYDNGWFTPEAAIIGGAQFISRDYIYNSTFQQDTLYKMRWNPVQQWHQYATDIGWAYKQVDNIYNLYQLLDNYTLYYDAPKYR